MPPKASMSCRGKGGSASSSLRSTTPRRSAIGISTGWSFRQRLDRQRCHPARGQLHPAESWALHLQVRGSGRTGVYSRTNWPSRCAWCRRLADLVVPGAGIGARRIAAVAGRAAADLRIQRRAAQLERLIDRRTAELTQAKDSAERALRQLQSAQDELVARRRWPRWVSWSPVSPMRSTRRSAWR